MNNINNEQVYINLKTKYSVDVNTHVYVEDVGEVYCKNNLIKKKVEKTRIYNGKEKEMYDYISGNEIITKVLDSIENIDVNIVGGPDVLLEIKEQEEPKVLLNFLKVFFVCLLLFFGAAIAIINFFEDVEMKNAIEKIFYIITGSREENPKIVTIPFSIGIGLGIFAFFYRVFSFSRRRRQEPGPLEVELYMYDKDVEDNIVHELKDKH
ncbi:stage V sporulation protein AA [Schnuerera sp. xch1]|uniref:stage V sporulation protein AA n=1 Tax=Schnuerera sp. xch1 TaxID=2874283 RepID=UPI001CBBD6EC|nr:stage V sporulation protein AA [Schnuerera sp. xch1]MBZ2173634.1 stage V sporulation protein AA [Schnuerera sp. xch1]